MPKDAKLLFLAGLTYCAAQLTDGRLTPGAVRAAAGMVDVKPSLSCELVKAGLWDVTEGGFLVHDYLEYNPTAEQVKIEREQAARRQKEWRQRRWQARYGGHDSQDNNDDGNASSNGVTPHVTNAINNGQVTLSPRAPALPSPSPSPAISEKQSYIHKDPFQGETQSVQTAEEIPPKKRGGRPKTPVHSEALGEFERHYEERFGFKPAFQNRRHAVGWADELAERFPGEQYGRLIEAFFSIKKAYYSERGFDLFTLLRDANGIMIALRSGNGYPVPSYRKPARDGNTKTNAEWVDEVFGDDNAAHESPVLNGIEPNRLRITGG